MTVCRVIIIKIIMLNSCFGVLVPSVRSSEDETGLCGAGPASVPCLKTPQQGSCLQIVLLGSKLFSEEQ